MKIKKNDLVKIMAGKDKGKEGKVTQIIPTEDKVVVDGVNKNTKNLKATKQGEKGRKIEFFSPVHVSNVQLVCPITKKPTRIGYKIEGKTKVRISKKAKAVIS